METKGFDPKATFVLSKISCLLKTYCPEISAFPLKLSRLFSCNNAKWFEKINLHISSSAVLFSLFQQENRESENSDFIELLHAYRGDKYMFEIFNYCPRTILKGKPTPRIYDKRIFYLSLYLYLKNYLRYQRKFYRKVLW